MHGKETSVVHANRVNAIKNRSRKGVFWLKPEKIKKLLLVQEKFFQTKKTFSVRYRIQILGRLYNSIQKYEKQIIKSLNKDLG